jgi:hypothetical protein
MEEKKEFLQGYEMKNWEFSPRIYKIIASATVFNLLFLTVIGQTNLLQAKACNSPLISKVCSVLDTVYVGSKLLSGDTDYVVKDYARTEIGDAEVVFVDTTGAAPQLKYPEGYFQVANRDELALLESIDSQFSTETTPFNKDPFPPANSAVPYTPPPAPRFRKTPRRNNNRGVFSKEQVLPKNNKNAVIGDLPDDPFETEDDGKNADKNNDGKNVADNKNNEKANKTEKDLKDKTATNSPSVEEVPINKKPLQDFVKDIVERWDKKEIDLTKPFAVRINAFLTDEGNFDPKKTRFVEQQGDEDIVNVAKKAIEAVGDSGFLLYLRNLDVKQVSMVFYRDGEKIHATVVSPQSSPEQARTKASGLRNLISISKLTVKGEDEKTLLKSAKVTSEGNNFFIKVDIPKAIADEMLNRKLGEELAKQKAQENPSPNRKKPNGIKENKTADDAAGK